MEFKDGATEKETDITADGTMLEFTIVVDAGDVPAAAMQTLQQTAKGALIRRIEYIEISYETKDGRVVKLPKSIVHYAFEIARADKVTEIVVNPDGTMVK